MIIRVRVTQQQVEVMEELLQPTSLTNIRNRCSHNTDQVVSVLKAKYSKTQRTQLYLLTFILEILLPAAERGRTLILFLVM